MTITPVYSKFVLPSRKSLEIIIIKKTTTKTVLTQSDRHARAQRRVVDAVARRPGVAHLRVGDDEASRLRLPGAQPRGDVARRGVAFERRRRPRVVAAVRPVRVRPPPLGVDADVVVQLALRRRQVVRDEDERLEADAHHQQVDDVRDLQALGRRGDGDHDARRRRASAELHRAEVGRRRAGHGGAGRRDGARGRCPTHRRRLTASVAVGPLRCIDGRCLPSVVIHHQSVVTTATTQPNQRRT